MGVARTKVIQAVYCLQCGGPADDTSIKNQKCGYCSAPLVPLDHPDPRTSLPCRQCATSIPASSQYCGQCGHPAGNEEEVGSAAHSCPGCGHHSMYIWNLGDERKPARIAVCSRCGGSFVSHKVLNTLIERENERFERTRGPGELRLEDVKRYMLPQTAGIKYKDCPKCAQRMHRKNYARLSGVVVDQCAKHGVYFDAGELPQVLGFVATGGLIVVRDRKARERAYEAKRARQQTGFGESHPAIYLDSMGPVRRFNPGLTVHIFGLLVRGVSWLLGLIFR